MLTVTDLSFAFGARDLFTGVSFALPDGAVMGLVGANGVGKTTLLRVLTGQLEPEGGTVKTNGTIGFLSQHDAPAFGQHTLWEVALSAFASAHRAEAQMRELETAMTTATGEALNALVERHAVCQQRFEAAGGYEAESRAAGALTGLGFPAEQWHQPAAALSGGQARRLTLAKLLLSRPDVLLLDEPTNHLDFDAMSFLETTLSAFTGTVVVVSHDRWLLDAVCTHIAELSGTALSLYLGNYTTYTEKAAEIFAQRRRDYTLQQREIARQEAIIARYRQYNREKSVRAANSRQRLLDRVERLERPTEDKKLRFALPEPPPLGQDALAAQGLYKSFEEKNVLQDVTLRVGAGDRLALVGPNGCGKTTLLRLLCSRLAPDAGVVMPGAGLKTGWFDQQQSTLPAGGTVLDLLRGQFPRMGDTALRTLLGVFLFPGEDALAEISVLSGGERARLMLLQLLLTAPNLMALDEPTNHLDMPSRIALEEALLAWPGTLLFVSHDRAFIDRLATKLLVWEGGVPTLFEGGWAEYQAHQTELAAPAKTAVNQTQQRKSLKAQREEARERKAAAAALQTLERQIAELEALQAQREEAMAQAEFYANPDTAAQEVRAYQADAERLDALLAQWADG